MAQQDRRASTPFHASRIDWDKLATEKRVVAMIHKATIGTARVDPAYASRKAEPASAATCGAPIPGGVAGNPEQQADFYIDTVRPAADELIALDLEDAQSTKLMNVDEAVLFVERVKSGIGRYPVLYTNHASAG